MRKDLLFSLLFLSIFALMFSAFTPLARTAQPPIDLNTLYEGQVGWGPVDADPVFAYDTQSEKLLFNVYQNLIAFHGESYYQFDPVLATNIPTRQDITLNVYNTSAVDSDPTGSTWTDGSTTYTVTGWTDELLDGFHSGDMIRMADGVAWRTWTADVVSGTSTVTMQLWRGAYVFNIRTSPTINFYDYTGAVYDTFGLKDALYCLQRLMVFDKPGYPSWMFDKPLFDVSAHTQWDNSTAMELANLVNDAIVGDFGANTLTINVGCRFPDNAFKQVLADTWGSIYSSKYYKDMGNWDGDLFATAKYGGPMPDWWIDWANQGLGLSNSALHTGTADAGLDVPTPTSYCGSGPYYVQMVDPVGNQVILQRNPGFWMGWPAPGCTSYLDTVAIRYIAYWTTRKAAFEAGEIDTCVVPRAYMFEILNNVTREVDRVNWPNVETIKNIMPGPGLTVDTVQFQFMIDPSSWYIGSGHFPDGIPLTFFNNTNVRKAFAYSFNYTDYINQAYFGEADYRQNTLAAGLYPDYYNATAAQAYYESLTNAEAELKAATVEGQNVWNSGFTLTIPYESGNDQRRIACEMINSFFDTLSTHDGRSPSAPPFTVDIAEIDSDAFVDLADAHKLPVYVLGRSTGFSYADDFMRPYLHSQGQLAYMQGYTAENGWGSTKDMLVDTALLTPDGPAKQALNDQLATIYYDDCPSFPIAEPWGRRWTNYWVKGWYYNALYPSDCYYKMFKADYSWYDISGATPGVPDGYVGTSDMSWAVAHNNARAPVPGLPPDPKWIGTYGCGGGCDVYGDRFVNMKDYSTILLHWTGEPGVAVSQLDSAKTVIGQGYGGNISLTVQNQHGIPENFNVTTYADATAISVLNFNFTGSGYQQQGFIWNTSGFAYGDYTLVATADVVPDETNTTDNNFTCTYAVHVGVPGDVSSSTPGVYDGKVSMLDIAYLISLFNTKPPSPNWNANADVDNSAVVNMIDIAIAILNFNKHE